MGSGTMVALKEVGHDQTLHMPAGRVDGIGQCARRESKDDTKVLTGRIELPFIKMGETVGEAGTGKCRKCKEPWFWHVKFKVPTRQGSWETE